MKRNEFIVFVNENSISSKLYSLDGDLKDDAFHLRKNRLSWEVFYYERGKEYNNVAFPSEENAFDYLYKVLKKCKK